MKLFKKLFNIQMFAALNYAEVYEQALDQPFKAGAKFYDLLDIGLSATGTYKYNGGNSIKVNTLSVTGFVDTDRDNLDGAFARNVDNAWATYTFDHDRDWDTLVDPMDIDETNMTLSIANITKVFNTEQKIPEVDKYVASKLYSSFVANGGTVSTTALTTGDLVIAEFDLAMTALDEGEVPEEGRILYITPAKYQLLKNALNIRREIGTMDAKKDITRMIDRLDSVKIVRPSTARMKSAYTFTVGAVPAPTAVQINMILIHPKAVIAPIKMEMVSIDEPSAKTRGKYLYYERMQMMAEILEQKNVAVYINADAPA